MVSKTMVVKAIIEKVENEYDDAQISTSLLDGYDKPDRIGFKGKTGEGYVPDIVLNRNDKTEFYCVELDKEYQVNKWRLFSLYTMKGNGSLNIVTPEDNLPHVREILNENNIKARLLYFS